MSIWAEIKKAINSDLSKPLDVLIKENIKKKYKITASSNVLATLVNSSMTIPSYSKGSTRLGIFEIGATGFMRVNVTIGTRDCALIVKANGATVFQENVTTGTSYKDVAVRQGDLLEVYLQSTHNSYEASCSLCTIAGTVVEHNPTSFIDLYS